MLQNNRFMQIYRMDFLINAKSRNQLVIVYLSQGIQYMSHSLVLNIHISDTNNVLGSEYFYMYYNRFSGGGCNKK